MVMQNQMSVAAAPRFIDISAAMQLAAALAIGFLVLYGAAFVSSPAVHNAAHDGRHSQAFPCH
jgi:cobalt transporter subunit CbtB